MYRRFFPAVSQYPQRHFFDNAATTQMCQVAIDAAIMLNQMPRANVGRGVYQEAEEISELYEHARTTIANCIGAKTHEIIFCRGTTDALNMAARALVETMTKDQSVVISDAEHHSNFLPWVELCQQKNYPVYRLPVSAKGVIDLSYLSELTDRNIAILSITHCSNVTGIINDMATITKWCRQNNVSLVVDGAQMVQHHLPDVSQLDVDVYCFSGHKSFAGSGLGVLYINENLLENWHPTIWGGGMIANMTGLNQPSLKANLHAKRISHDWLTAPQKLEAGTPSYQQAVILSQALQWFAKLSPEPLKNHHQALFDKADSILQKYDFIDYLHNPDQPRNPIFSFNYHTLHAHDAAQLFDQLGFCVRAGHHCAKPLMHSLQLNACLRISLSCYNTAEELELFDQALQKVYQRSQDF